MTTTTQTRIIVLQLTDDVLAQLRPFMAGLDITPTTHREWGCQEVYAQGWFAGYERIEYRRQQLTMCGEVYDVLAARVGDALDYEVRWQPNEYEPEGFVERVSPLALTNGIRAPVPCSRCGAQIFANRAEVVCACGQAVALIS